MAATKGRARKGKAKKAKGESSGGERTVDRKSIEYAKDRVVPLLNHLGFLEVSLNHGIDALSGDVLFADYDRLGNKLRYAAHVSAEAVSGKEKKAVSAIVAHAVEALEVRFEDPTSGEETSLSSLLVITSEEFTNNAVKQILGSKDLSGCQHRLFFYEGRHLDELARRAYRTMNELLRAAKNELKKNSSIAQYNMDSWGGGKASLFRYQTNNTQRLIDYLVMKDEKEETRKKLEKYTFLIDSFNQAANIVLFSNTPSSTVHHMKRLEEGASAVYKQSEELLEEVEPLINEPSLSS